MAAIRREIRTTEKQFEEADAQYGDLSAKLRNVTQERLNTEEALMAANVRLKQLLGELQSTREAAQAQGALTVQDSKMTMGELTRKVEQALIGVLDERFRDEAFTSAITEQSSLSADKVRVEFEGDEVFWQLQDNYSFEMLLQDAARYWDVAPEDAMLVDERGAIWPSDAYVQLEVQRFANAKIALKIKAVVVHVEEDIEMYGREGDASSDDSEEEVPLSLLAVATAAEDELLLAQARGTMAKLTVKQKLAIRKKVRRELYYFLAFVLFFVWSVYTRRTVKEAFRLQDAMATAFTDENFGDFNEKTYYDIATAEELFDWMAGPLQDGLFPDAKYNGQPIVEDRRGYVMTYNRIVGKIRLRQLRVAPGAGCDLSIAVKQTDTTSDGRFRRRQFVDYCYAPYSVAARSNKTYGDAVGFSFSSAEANNLKTSVQGQTGVRYDGSGFTRDLDAKDRDAYIAALDELRSNLWLDEQTRAVVVSINLYNGNYNFYCVSQFLIEFTPGGTIVPSATNKIMRIDQWEAYEFQRPTQVLIQFVPEVLTGVGSLAYLLHFLYKLYRIKKVTRTFRPFLRDAWNIADTLFLLSLGLTYLLRVQYFLNPDRIQFNPFLDGIYQEMSPLASAYASVFTCDATTVLLLVLKSLKYFSLQKDLMLLQKTLVQALSDLAAFLFLLFFLFFGFVMMGFNIFGMQATGFKSIQDTIGTLFLILLGEFDYEEMRAVHEVWAIIFFLFFVIFMFFIVLNIFLAILNDAYTVVHTDVQWEELERRKAMSLREKFEVRKAIWRERRNIAKMRKAKKEKVKAAKRFKKEYEKKQKDRAFLDKIGRRRRREAKHDEAAGASAAMGADATSSTRGAGAGAKPGTAGGARRTAAAKSKPFA